jgi:son of sevenless
VLAPANILDQLRFLDSPSLLPLRGTNKVPAEDPKHLAIALTILEGDRYKRILPGECVAYLRRQFDQTELDSTQRPAFKAKHWVRPDLSSIRRRRLINFQNNVDELRRTNNKIIFWVKDSVLRPNDVDTRIDRLRYFLLAAEVREMHTTATVLGCDDAF